MKPIGAYDVSIDCPPWVSIGMLDPALPLPAPRPGFWWVVQIGFHESPFEDAGVTAARVRGELEAAGLWPQVLAFMYGEEWYARWSLNGFAHLGLPVTSPNALRVIRDYLGQQHGRIKAATGKAIFWLENAVTPEWQPPAHTDFVGVDAYVPDGQTFAATAWPVFEAAERATSLPLVVVARWFAYSGPRQGDGWAAHSQPPSDDMAEGYAWVLRRPRWVALVGFLWGSRPGGDLVGLKDQPGACAAVCRSLGVA